MITHINGVSLIGETNTDKMLSLISKGRRKPISMTVTKCFNAKLERLYPPIVPLLKSVGLDVDEIYRLPFASSHKTIIRNLFYIGEIILQNEEQNINCLKLRTRRITTLLMIAMMKIMPS